MGSEGWAPPGASGNAVVAEASSLQGMGDSSGCPRGGGCWAGKPEGSPGRTTVATPSGYPSAGRAPALPASVSPDAARVQQQWDPGQGEQEALEATGSGRSRNKDLAQNTNKNSPQNCLDKGVRHNSDITAVGFDSTVTEFCFTACKVVSACCLRFTTRAKARRPVTLVPVYSTCACRLSGATAQTATAAAIQAPPLIRPIRTTRHGLRSKTPSAIARSTK